MDAELAFAIVIGIISLSAFVVVVVMSILNRFSSNRWFCDKVGWHLTPDGIGFDGCSFTGICPRCGEKVLQDSQGNWF